MGNCLFFFLIIYIATVCFFWSGWAFFFWFVSVLFNSLSGALFFPIFSALLFLIQCSAVFSLRFIKLGLGRLTIRRYESRLLFFFLSWQVLVLFLQYLHSISFSYGIGMGFRESFIVFRSLVSSFATY